MLAGWREEGTVGRAHQGGEQSAHEERHRHRVQVFQAQGRQDELGIGDVFDHNGTRDTETDREQPHRKIEKA